MRERPSVAATALVLMALATGLGIGSAGCAGAPGLGPLGGASWEAAHLYTSGTGALDRGEAESAVRQLERAVALAPWASEIRNHLGLAYAAVGRPEAAQRSFEDALQLDCRNDAARRNLDWVRAPATSFRETPASWLPAQPSRERP